MGKLNIDELCEYMRYDPETGKLYHRKAKTKREEYLVGREVGHLCKGYLKVTFRGLSTFVHRLAWALMTGQECESGIDHINRVKTDNRWVNLRAADARSQQENKVQANANNKVGLLGVKKRPNCKRYEAVIKIKGKWIYLGRFDTAEQASARYMEMKRLHHKGFIE